MSLTNRFGLLEQVKFQLHKNYKKQLFILKKYLRQRPSLAKLRKIRLNLLSTKIQRAWRLSDPETRRRNRNKTKRTHESKLRYRSLIPKSCFSTTTVEMPSLTRTVVRKDSDSAPSYRRYISGINWDERCPNCNKFFITKIIFLQIQQY